MAIFRGTGGSGDSTQDATLNEVTQQATNASNSATAAAASATTAGSSESAVATSATNAATSATNAATSEDNALTSKNAAATSATSAATSATDSANSASTASTKASEASTSAAAAATDLVATNQDTLDTAADLVLTNADVVLTNADVVLTHADVVLTVADVVLTHADVVLAEADKVQTGLDRVATAADVVSTAADVTTTGNSVTAAANSAASAAAALDSFDDRYLGAKSSAPSTDNDGAALVEGALYFDSGSNGMKVYDGATWIAASSAGTASMLTYRYIATSAQTTFSGSDANSATLSYTVSNIIVLLNGIALDSSDFTATSGTSIVLGTGATTSDELVVVAFKSFTVADHYTKTAADARFEPIDSAYTKSEGDARYEPIDSAYTKAEADSLLNAKETVVNVALKAPLASPSFTGGIDVTGTSTLAAVTASTVTSTGGKFATTGTTELTLESASNMFFHRPTGNGYYWRDNAAGSYVERMRLISTGLAVTGDVTSSGNLVIGTSGKGIDFGATGGPASGSTGTSEILDDYEEGTWSPTLAGAVVTSSEGKYTKVGNLVHFQARLAWTSGGSGNIFGGLPYTATTGGGASHSMTVTPYINGGWPSPPTGKGWINGYVNLNSTSIYFYWQPISADATLQASGNVYYQGSYIAA